MRRPDFFIVGAARSGTTSVWRCLKEHPEVYMPSDAISKEPAFFSDKPSRWNAGNYLSLFLPAREAHRRVGEASTAYLSDPAAARRIHCFNPAARIIIILRPPADRAYSLYNWMVQEGYEYAACFEKALALESARFRKRIPGFWEPEFYWNYMYFSSGLYSRQVKRYLDLFGDNVLLIAFENLKSDINRTLARVCRFLEVAPMTVRPEVHNRSRGVYHPLVQFGLRKINGRLNVMRRRLCGRAVTRKSEQDFLLRIGWKATPPAPMRTKTRRLLEQAYAEDIRRLNAMTGLRLGP